MNNPYLKHLNTLMSRVHREFSTLAPQTRWINSRQAAELQDRRDALLEGMAFALHKEFGGTKPWINSISEGCRRCGAGEWSCLFIAGRCNARCFYCPSPQDQDDLPQTQRLRFADPAAYAEYVARFGFTGVAFSGGEPLMVLPRTLAYLSEVRRQGPGGLYVWLYTNGILGSREIFRELGARGLDEIRFDLGATGYDPRVLAYAAEFIPHITVEIPAVPEDTEQLSSLLDDLVAQGVTNLNLHQLRMSPHNAPRLDGRPYTFLHGEAPTVAESELTALTIMAQVLELGLPLGVNYCSFQFKNRFQKAGFRRKMARSLAGPGESVTEQGFVRIITPGPGGPPLPEEALDDPVSLPDSLTFTYRALLLENDSPLEAGCFSANTPSCRVVNAPAAPPVTIGRDSYPALTTLLSSDGSLIPEDPDLFVLWRHEFVEQGLRDYF